MATQLSIQSEIHRLFGDLDDNKIGQIDALHPTLDELEVTAAYLAGMDDIMGKERLPLTGKTAQIYDIVTRDDLLAEDDYRTT